MIFSIFLANVICIPHYLVGWILTEFRSLCDNDHIDPKAQV